MKMGFRIAIPSLSRPQSLKTKTMHYLAQTDIDMRDVDVFLSKREELAEYKEALRDYPVNFIVTDTCHINTQRNAIVNYYTEGACILGIDDDIQSVRLKVDDKTTTLLTDLTEFSANAFNMCKENKVDLWGINPVLNPFFMSHRVSLDLKYICACFYGWINRHGAKAYVSTDPEYGKEDFERSIRYYQADGAVIRFNYAAPQTTYYKGGGGIQTYRTVQNEEQAVRWLLEMFPHHCKRNTAKKGKYPEVRLIPTQKKSAPVLPDSLQDW